MRSIRCALGIHDMQWIQDAPGVRNYVCVRCGLQGRGTEPTSWTPGELAMHGHPVETRTQQRITPADLHQRKESQ